MATSQQPSWKNHMKGGATRELITPAKNHNFDEVPNSDRAVVKTIKGVFQKSDSIRFGEMHGKGWELELTDSSISFQEQVYYWTLNTFSEYGARNFIVETVNLYPEVSLALINWEPFQTVLDKLDPDSDRFQVKDVETNVDMALLLVMKAINESIALQEVKLLDMLK